MCSYVTPEVGSFCLSRSSEPISLPSFSLSAFLSVRHRHHGRRVRIRKVDQWIDFPLLRIMQQGFLESKSSPEAPPGWIENVCSVLAARSVSGETSVRRQGSWRKNSQGTVNHSSMISTSSRVTNFHRSTLFTSGVEHKYPQFWAAIETEDEAQMGLLDQVNVK